MVGSQDITLPLAVVSSCDALPMIISSFTKLPNTFSSVISTKSGIEILTSGKLFASYPCPAFATEIFDIPPEIVATAVAPEPDLVELNNYGND